MFPPSNLRISKFFLTYVHIHLECMTDTFFSGGSVILSFSFSSHSLLIILMWSISPNIIFALLTLLYSYIQYYEFQNWLLLMSIKPMSVCVLSIGIARRVSEMHHISVTHPLCCWIVYFYISCIRSWNCWRNFQLQMTKYSYIYEK